jgi:enamine deaminase RidA (YjgF/YER057c/UK114 family)
VNDTFEARLRYTTSTGRARTLVEVSKLYGPDFMIEIEAIAAV